MPPSPKTSITLSASAEAVLNRTPNMENKSARISQIITRYGMLLNRHSNEYIDTFIEDPLVRHAVLDWGEVYPIPAIHMRDVLGIIVNDRLTNRQDLPSKEKINSLYEQSAHLSAVDQMVIVEAIEASRSR
jgi:hypothetical protein